MEELRRRRYSQRYHRTLKKWGQEEKKPKGIQEQEKVEKISKIQHLEIEP